VDIGTFGWCHCGTHDVEMVRTSVRELHHLLGPRRYLYFSDSRNSRIFWINIPLCVIPMIGLYFALNLKTDSSSLMMKLSRIDYIGILVSAAPPAHFSSVSPQEEHSTPGAQHPSSSHSSSASRSTQHSSSTNGRPQRNP
jgi:hypothetical protein